MERQNKPREKKFEVVKFKVRDIDNIVPVGNKLAKTTERNVHSSSSELARTGIRQNSAVQEIYLFSLLVTILLAVLTFNYSCLTLNVVHYVFNMISSCATDNCTAI